MQQICSHTTQKKQTSVMLAPHMIKIRPNPDLRNNETCMFICMHTRTHTHKKNVWSHLGLNGVLDDVMSLKHLMVNWSETV